MNTYHFCLKRLKNVTCHFYDKTRYVVHIKLLQSWTKIKKVHRVVQFDQSAWMKKYIQLNNELRKKAINDFEKDFFKMMYNAVFGKTMQNVISEKELN